MVIFYEQFMYLIIV